MHKQIFSILFTLLFIFGQGVASAAAQESATPEPEMGSDTATNSIVPLEANGLVAQTLTLVGRWADSLGNQLDQITQAAFELPSWFREIFSSEEGRALLMQALIGLAVVFAIGLTFEWGFRYMLRRPRRALIRHAEEAEEQAREERIHEKETQLQVVEKERSEEHDAPTAAGLRLENAGVALVQTHRNGVDQVETIPVGPMNEAGGGPQATQETSVTDSANNAETVGHARHAAANRASMSGDHRNALRHLPFAVGALIIDLLPLVLFFSAAGLAIHWLAGGDERIHVVMSGFVNAYVITRMIMAVVRLLVSPAGPGLCLLKVGHGLAVILHVWLRRFVVLSTFSIALAGAMTALGASPAGSLVIVKVASLLVHISAVILIFKTRHVVGEAIAASPEEHGPLASMRNWLAQVWAFFASALVIGIWVVWALGVEDGFPKLIHFITVSGGIIIIARLVAILALGALDRAQATNVSGGQNDGPLTSPSGDIPDRLVERYYPSIRRLISLVITVCTIVALCQAWGLDMAAWFAPGTIGRSLVSAIMTISIAVAVAFLVWQTANSAVEQRLVLWDQQGERMRAARLRTLLPILRSCLFIIIALIIALTALNEIGINTTPLLAGASIVGVAIGFGSQKLVQDFITGIFLLMENAMKVGDWVTVAGVSGSVENLSIRTVRLRAGDGSLHIIPFSSVSTVNNTNFGIGNAAVNIGVGYDTDIERAIAELKNIGTDLRSDPAFKDLILNDFEVWGVDSVDGSMVTLVGRIQCIDKGRWGVQREMNRRILERFRELGIKIADPRARLLMPYETESSVASQQATPPH